MNLYIQQKRQTKAVSVIYMQEELIRILSTFNLYIYKHDKNNVLTYLLLKCIG